MSPLRGTTEDCFLSGRRSRIGVFGPLGHWFPIPPTASASSAPNRNSRPLNPRVMPCGHRMNEKSLWCIVADVSGSAQICGIIGARGDDGGCQRAHKILPFDFTIYSIDLVGIKVNISKAIVMPGGRKSPFALYFNAFDSCCPQDQKPLLGK